MRETSYSRVRPASRLVLPIGLLVAASCLAAPTDVGYTQELTAWRAKADEGLRRERGWLSIVGRWELAPGTNRIGSASGNDVVLPKSLSPAQLATVEIGNGRTRLRLASNQTMQTVEKAVPGQAFSERELLDGTRSIEWVTAGRLSLQFVKRDDGRIVMRAADRDAPARTAFGGRQWYEPKAEYRVPARFVPQPPGTQIPIANVRGEISYENVAGCLEMTLEGKPVRLDALDDEGDLFVIFRDATSGQTTYPPGRFISIAKPADGSWVVDFNKAYNPPCAFSAYTTCPLPPPQNWLALAVPAGERYGEPTRAATKAK